MLTLTKRGNEIQKNPEIVPHIQSKFSYMFNEDKKYPRVRDQ